MTTMNGIQCVKELQLKMKMDLQKRQKRMMRMRNAEECLAPCKVVCCNSFCACFHSKVFLSWLILVAVFVLCFSGNIFTMCTCQDSDSDWAPEVQGAANVEKSEEEALKVLLQPNFVKETSAEFLGLMILELCTKAVSAGHQIY